MRRQFLALACCLLPSLACAHHGQDFLLVESPTVPHAGNAYLLANADWSLDGDAEERASFAPALLVGLSPRVAFELHVHAADLAGEGWHTEAIAPALHVLLTDPEAHDGLKVGLSGEYEFGRGDESDAVEVRLSAEKARGRMLFAGNLIAEKAQHEDLELAASFGLRGQVGERVALGLEAQHPFDGDEGAELLAGAYLGTETSWTMKFGVGLRRNDEGDSEGVARLGLVLKLR